MTTLYYCIERDCRLKRRTTLPELVTLLHRPEVAALWTSPGRWRSTAEEALPALHCQVESGAEPVAVQLAPEEVARNIALLRKERRRCRECPANLYANRGPDAHGLGCIGAVPLPIRAEEEQALLDVARAMLESAAELDLTVTLPIRFIWDNGLRGEEVAALRERPGFFELAEPVEARIGPFLQKQLLSTDQFLSLCLLPGRLQLAHLHLFAPFYAEFVRRGLQAGEDGAQPPELLVPWLGFFHALAIASEQGASVAVMYVREESESHSEDREQPPRLTTPAPAGFEGPTP